VNRCVLQIKGGVADLDGQLVPGDQILVINGSSVQNASQPEIAALLKVKSYKYPSICNKRYKLSKNEVAFLPVALMMWTFGV
jgi:PDZ domain